LPEVSRRVLIATGKYHLFIYKKILGLDASSMRAYVDWETFLKLYCIFDMGEVEK
jgi:hypothetical protein